MAISYHNDLEGHRVMVAFARGDNDELLYLRYSCEDPTCDWCIAEFGPDECMETARIIDSLLTHEICDVKTTGTGREGERQVRSPSTQLNIEGLN